MTDKIPLDVLKARLAGNPRPAAKDPAARKRYVLAQQRLECTVAGAAFLLNVANLAREIDGFPSEIPLMVGGDGAPGLSVRRGPDGVWRIEGPYEVLFDVAAFVLGKPARETALGAVLSAIGVPNTPEAIVELGRHGGWEGSGVRLAVKLHGVQDAVPGHVVAASLGLGTGLLQALGAGTEDEHREAWIDAVTAFHSIGACPVPGVPPAILRVCREGDYEMLHCLMRYGANEATDSEGNTPFLTVALRGDEGGIRPLLQWKANHLATNALGRTALHCAASAAVMGRCEDVTILFQRLIFLGCDPRAVDGNGATPAKVLAQAYEDDGSNLSREQFLEIRALEEELSDGPGHGV
jgi:hypothetical protein